MRTAIVIALVSTVLIMGESIWLIGFFLGSYLLGMIDALDDLFTDEEEDPICPIIWIS